MRRAPIWLWLSVLLALVAILLAWRLSQQPDGRSLYIAGRTYMLEQQALNAPEGLTLIVGDSIVEQAYHRDLCGAPVFNAGISSAALRDLAPLATSLASTLKPARIILAIGTNDAAIGRITPTSDWVQAYETLVSSLPVDHLTLVALPQVEPGKSASGAIDGTDLVDKNRALQALAARHRVAFAPPVAMGTHDGIHPTALGASAWRENVASHCPAAAGGSAAAAIAEP